MGADDRRRRPLLKRIHGRWRCLPLAFAFYLRRETLARGCVRRRGQALSFTDQFTQPLGLICQLARVLPRAPVLVVTDSWFGNKGLFRPLRAQLGVRARLLSRLRVNATLDDHPTPTPGQPGRPRKYGARLGNAGTLAATLRAAARTYSVHVYSATREVLPADQVVLLKSLRCPVRVVWV